MSTRDAKGARAQAEMAARRTFVLYSLYFCCASNFESESFCLKDMATRRTATSEQPFPVFLAESRSKNLGVLRHERQTPERDFAEVTVP